jgi:hypothetical protein
MSEFGRHITRADYPPDRDTASKSGKSHKPDQSGRAALCGNPVVGRCPSLALASVVPLATACGNRADRTGPWRFVLDPTRKKILAWVGAALIGLGLIAAAFFLSDNDLFDGRRDGRNRGVQIKQAKWKIGVHTVAGQGLPNSKRHVTKRATQNLEEVVRNLYNALVLRPGMLDKIAHDLMLPSAAADLKRSGIKIPEQARRVQTLRREALIGVEASSGARAAADVTLVATGMARGHRFRATSRDRLWIERHAGKWRVIAYELNREPFQPKPPGKKGDQGPGKKPSKPPAKAKDGKKGDNK